jgi:prepilin-type N-terminal cleavage/methylation domain-containing protein
MDAFGSPARAGFSLVELLGALAVAAVLAGVAVLSWPRFEAALQLEAALRQLAADLQAARMLAVASASRVRLVLAPGGTTYVRERTDAGGEFRLEAARSLPRGVTVAEVNSGGDLTFSGRGQGENATVVLADRRGVRRALTLNQRGRITISPVAP